MHPRLTVAILALGALLGPVASGYAQLTGPINVRALPSPCTSSAAGNGTTDDTDEFECAIDLVPARGGEIYVPAGKYLLTRKLDITDKPIAFRGEGKRVSLLIWDNVADNGIEFFSNSNNGPLGKLHHTFAVRSLSLIKKNASGGAAIRGQWQGDGDHAEHGGVTVTIHDVHIGTFHNVEAPGAWAAEIDAVHWSFGIQLVQTRQAKISAFDIQGSGIAGIQIAGKSNELPCPDNDPFDDDPNPCKSISVRIRDGVIIKANRGIETRDWVEGLHVEYVSIREAERGMQLKGSSPGPGGVGTSVANNYIHARLYGIESINTYGVAVTNNLVERFGTEAFQGLSFSSGGDLRVTGNTIKSVTGNGGEGIVLSGTNKENVIEGNITVNMSTGIYLNGAGVTKNVVKGNLNRAWTTAQIGGTLLPNYVSDNH